MEKAGSSKEAPSPKRTIMARRGTGSTGRHISLLANHFKVYVKHPDTMFYQYSVCSFFLLFFSFFIVC